MAVWGQSWGQSAVTLFPLQNYNFGEKPPNPTKDTSVEARVQRIQQQYPKQGARRSVEAVLLVVDHRFPHVLLLQSGDSFRLPGGRLRPGENEVDGLRRKLTTLLSPEAKAVAVDWQVGECVGAFWRPAFDYNLYPYCPAHITKPKEIKKLFLVPLPEKCFFAIPTNLQLVAVPLYELYDNAATFGPVVASLPQMMARFRLNITGPLTTPSQPSATSVKTREAPADDDELALQLYGA